jgi:prevent-host-death family protein
MKRRHLSIIREAEKEKVVITHHGKPAAVVIGLRDDDWFDHRVEHDERFLRKVSRAISHPLFFAIDL